MFGEPVSLPFGDEIKPAFPAADPYSLDLPFGDESAKKADIREEKYTLPEDEFETESNFSLSWDTEAMVNKAKNTKVLRRCPVGDHMTVTDTETGERFYLRLYSPESMVNTQNLFRKKGLLDRAFREVYDEAYEQLHRRKIERAIHEDDANAGINESISRKLTLSDEPSFLDHEANSSLKTKLWVDKYSPKLYTELLSDDGVNRKLLKWLKLWDPIVFGVDAPKYATKPDTSKRETNKNNNFASKYHQNESNEEFTLDEAMRPRFKIALLCGAPGLGKTTLAHVIAQQAGYDIVEVNASDDRSPEVFASRIEATTQSLSSLTRKHRPQCLILDEIDGAPSNSVTVLVNLVNGKGRSNKTVQKLSRPIICICNDVFAKALRQLRSTALVLHFPQTVTAKLSSRLGKICSEEKLVSHVSALMMLCEKSDNDIRSCLNSLQFMAHLSQEITIELVSSKIGDRKDSHKTLFDLWKEVFHLPVSRKRRQDANNLKSTNRGGNCRFDKVRSTASMTGEYEKSTIGIYENFLRQKVHDSYLESAMEALEWIGFYDLLNEFIQTRQMYSLMAYFPYISVLFHLLYSSPKLPYLTFPQKHSENRQIVIKNSQTILSLIEGTHPYTRTFLVPNILNLDILPYLLTIISPTMRPINTQLYSSREKQQLSELVDTMICYNLTYKQEMGANGQYQYIFEPPVEDLVQFHGITSRVYLTYGAKQLIGREIDVEKMVRAEHILKRQGSEMIVEKSEKKETKSAKKTSHIVSATNLHKSHPNASITEEVYVAKDFFGRTIDPSLLTDRTQNAVQRKYSKFYIRFKFNEGVTDAIRRQVKMRDFM